LVPGHGTAAVLRTRIGRGPLGRPAGTRIGLATARRGVRRGGRGSGSGVNRCAAARGRSGHGVRARGPGARGIRPRNRASAVLGAGLRNAPVSRAGPIRIDLAAPRGGRGRGGSRCGICGRALLTEASAIAAVGRAGGLGRRDPRNRAYGAVGRWCHRRGSRSAEPRPVAAAGRPCGSGVGLCGDRAAWRVARVSFARDGPACGPGRRRRGDR
jgi:hypothetical protein